MLVFKLAAHHRGEVLLLQYPLAARHSHPQRGPEVQDEKGR